MKEDFFEILKEGCAMASLPKKRGRPKTDNAKTAAERQKAYRKRQEVKEIETAKVFKYIAGEEAKWRKKCESLEHERNYYIDLADKYEAMLREAQMEVGGLKEKLRMAEEQTKNKNNVTKKKKAKPDGTPGGYQQTVLENIAP